MMVHIKPSVAKGCVTAPPSKSMAHRALLCGALSAGSTVQNLAYSQDVCATLSCLQKLGADVNKKGDTVTLGGLNPCSISENIVIDCGESGSTLRFLLPLCMLANVPVTLTGHGRLFQRPLSVYEDVARNQGVEWKQTENGLTVCGRLKSGEYAVRGDVSSQFITGLLFALPLLDGDSRLEVNGAFESASYIDLTMEVLAAFGIVVERRENTFYIRGGQTYASADYTVEGDCSNAAFLDAFNLLGGDVKVQS
ncbi:MAG: 3-phosphoshikimate 1-carboxyvinyltransferase, partial [Clostridia bacterium]|nr:3-phosphoshikimate 1-carboxyvinyltransferase [Clostridia bacterium]